MDSAERTKLLDNSPQASKFIKNYIGAQELLDGQKRYCIWIEDEKLDEALQIQEIESRIKKVREMRLQSKAPTTRDYAIHSHKFRQIQGICKKDMVVIPRVTSENRKYLPVGMLTAENIISDRNFGILDAPIWSISLISSVLHRVWIDVVCGKLETRFLYSNTIGWNAFPLPKLTEKNKIDLLNCSVQILLAREAHFPATVSDLYDTDDMPKNLQAAHDYNDEVLERIYIGRRFKNDTERLEKLFELYAKMTTAPTARESMP